MPTINLAGTMHGSKREAYAGGVTIDYFVYPEVSAVDKARVKSLKEAVKIVDGLVGKIDLSDPCNRYFKTLGKGRSLNILWGDKTIFLDFSPSVQVGFYGATHSNDQDVSLSAWCLDNNNRWMIAATLVHEFAHIGGAPGGASHAAEKAADKCYFDPQYNPSIMGSIQGMGYYLSRLG